MEELKVEPHGGQLWLEWKSHNSKAVSEYVVEWVNADQTDWQRERRSTRRTVIKGNILFLKNCDVKVSEPYFLWNKWFSVCVCLYVCWWGGVLERRLVNRQLHDRLLGLLLAICLVFLSVVTY